MKLKLTINFFKSGKFPYWQNFLQTNLKACFLVCLMAMPFSLAYAQVVITEIFSNGTFTLHNTGDSDVDVSSYWACNFPLYEQLENLTVECGSLVMPAGDELTIAGFTENFSPGDSEFGLYINSGFSSPNNIISYVDWGTPGGGRSGVAVAAGIWTADEAVPAFSDGESIQYDGEGISASDWTVQMNSAICSDGGGMDALAEARAIVALGAQEAGRTVEDFNGVNRSFPENYANFLPSVIALDDLRDPNKANATIPLYEGIGPNGEPTYFIITEATSIALAQEYGAIVSPKLIYGNRPDAAASAQRVEVVDGKIQFRGDVDFSPERIVTAGSPNAFPPAFVQPGAVGDAEYSSMVVLPSGEVINAQIVANATGVHDRINEINIEERWANFQLLDGWEGGDQFYYHLVTDASDPGPAAIELGVYAPRMANLPTFGISGLEPETVLLGFSPNVNGLTATLDGVTDENRQGLGSTIIDNDLDPVNIFPFDPDNTIEAGNNYSPMWDAHLNMWTDEAINGPNGDQRRAITSFADLFSLIDQGLITSFAGSPGIENDFVNGLRASHAVINCPVICHPFQGEAIASPEIQEARSIVVAAAAEAGRTVEDFNGANRSFPENYANFLPSVIALDDLRDPNKANATLPLYEGVGPNGEPTYFIVTEATSIALAQEYGAIVSPKLIYGNRADAAASAQRVNVVDGKIYFKGDVDFSPERIVTAGSPNAFPPAFVQPGAVGDAEYSSMVVLPSGEVINAQIVANATGVHDRINEINIEERWANFQLLDGWEGGDQFYYHLVTDASDPGPAAIELGVYAPRMANLPTFGISGLEPETVLLGFSPNVNGLTATLDGVTDENRQGLGSTIIDNDLDPVNIFPFDPDNTIEAGNNYSPMWDAHLNMWTDEAINGPNGDQRRAITSFADLFSLIDQGLITSFAGSPGIENDFVNGLRASHAVINCPVICHPFQGEAIASPEIQEARSIVVAAAAEAGRTVEDFNGANRSFPENYANFLPSVIALDDLRDPNKANATLPLYEGVGPNGEPTYFIVTEATSIALAQEYGAIVSPKLIYGNRAEAAASAQRVNVIDGKIYFKGDVDFSPERIVTAGSPNAFPPAFVQPGAVGDEEYSSMVVLPSGEVINAQIVANATGVHDRINEINIEERWANFQLLDGWEGGDQFYYHLVTDASDPGPAAIELGVYAPRMANLPTFGVSGLEPETVLLGFSPNVNGLSIAEDGVSDENRQGLGSTILDNDLDPVNIFPFDPDNTIEAGNNYSPMWDAHLNMWTDEAINGAAGDQRRAITSFADLFNLIDQGLVTSFAGSPGIENDFVNGLRASHAVINCPVICHPFQGEDVIAGDFVGGVYAMTNGEGQVDGNVQGPNAVVAYGQAADGTLTIVGTYPTGGNGGDFDGGEGLDPLISAYALTKTPDNQFVLAVNAGSSSVTAMKVNADFSLTATATGNTEDLGPNSIAFKPTPAMAGVRGLVYVSNITRAEFLAQGEPAQQGSVIGFWLTDDGNLVPVDNSIRDLANRPSAVQFSPDGNFLVVASINSGASALASGSEDELVVYTVNADGTLSAGAVGAGTSTLRGNAEGRNLPSAIGFQIVGDNYVVVTEAREFQPNGAPPAFPALQDGSVSTWQIQADGSLTPIDLDVASGTNNTGRTACWLDFSDENTFFVSNAIEAGLAAYSFNNGDIELLDQTAAQGTGATGNTTDPAAAFGTTEGWIDLWISDDGKYLYQLFGLSGEIGVYAIDGTSLTLIEEISGDLPVNNTQGIVSVGPPVLEPVEEARSIVVAAAAEAGRTVEDFNGANRSFPDNYANFLPSVIALDDLRDPNKANATLPLYEGVGPNGEPTYFIITEATSIALAQEYGAIVSPKLIYGNRPDAAASAQRVNVVDGKIYFKGDVDFSPERIVTPGSPNAFPPAFVQPGAVGDAEYSSMVVLPSGEVINAQIVANATGVHDRINEINIEERWANFQLLDGWEGGDQFYYHLVTDASDPGPAAIELGVYAPRMANLPTFGISGLEPETVLLGFSPNVNGLTATLDGVTDENRQGLGSTIIDNDLDPVNIFPFDPDNTIEEGNNYSPMWDAHLNMWTDEAINGPNGDQRRAITSFADLFSLIDQGLITSFAGSPGIENDFVNGLRASHAVINCPVICHPFQGEAIASPEIQEARSIVVAGAAEAGRTVEDFNGSERSFPENYANFLPSVIALDDLRDPNKANATLPLYEGVGPNGEPTYFIITEATSIALAQEYGAIVSPKLIYGNRAEAAASAQRVNVVDGKIYFKGDVDFSPERIVTAGSPNAFPPAFVQPGAVGDAEYSSMVVLPSGEVINAQIVANATGVHDRINEINIEERWANFQLLDGWEGGDQFYYHLVTDASDPGPAAIELGVYAPRMANLPTFGISGLEPETVLLGFSPNVNGLTATLDGVTDENRQGLGSTIIDNDLDPVNIFPFDPDNTIEEGNNYSPMWDAHLNMWTDEAINGPNGDQRRAITSFADLFSLIDQGLITSFAGSPGIENDFVNGLRASHAVINCPVICHPFQGEAIASPEIQEARSIVVAGAAEAGRTVEDFNGSERSFPENYANFLPSVIALDDLRDPNKANATLPLYEGVGPNGEPTYFIITEATSIALAQEYGAIVSPKLIYGNRAEAAASAQRVNVVDGKIYFKGDVDFSPERIVTAGSPNAFPPAFVQPGAVGDDEYSSMVVLPSGEVINAQIVANATGVHDRINEINIEERWANFQLLDGWEGGDQFYYHLVTDASDPGPAAIELGVYAPRMANLPTFGISGLEPETVLLGFSPNVNGLTATLDGVTDENRQGLGSTIIDNDLDPVNIFPFDPDNTIEAGNNYSPMWDAHLNMWTDEAINGPNGDQRRAITSFADLFSLIDQGLITSFAGSPGIENDFVNGLRASHAVINCPVICHPFQGEAIASPEIQEARSIVVAGAAEAGRTVEDFNGANRSFPEEYANFLPSVIALADLEDPALANATLPLYEGVGPNGEPTYFIITEATSIALAQEYGAIVSPKLIYGNRANAAAAAQRVNVVDGKIYFKGDVDFSPERIVTPGTPNAFPPAFVQPGAVGDEEYSSMVVLPSGEVINAQIVANATGVHDRINEINIEERWANFQLLDGWEGGDQYYYHLVTDASDPGPAAIELGVYAPRMANLPTFGVSELDPETVLLGFSPNVNGLTTTLDGVTDFNRQGLGSTIIDGDLDPVNIFPFDPDNTIEAGNNYSPMWDAHLNMWTDEAINGPNGDQRRAITSFADLFNLIEQGLVTSFTGSPGIENDFVGGLRASHAVINCPVICHPFQGRITSIAEVPSCDCNLAITPNPVSENASFTYELRERGQVNLRIVDALGRTVSQVLVGEQQAAGTHTISWNGTARSLPTGNYFAILNVDDRVETLKFVIQGN